MLDHQFPLDQPARRRHGLAYHLMLATLILGVGVFELAFYVALLVGVTLSSAAVTAIGLAVVVGVVVAVAMTVAETAQASERPAANARRSP